MGQTVQNFLELTPESQTFAGGKGGMLVKLFQAGYPIPEGFVVLPSAFHNGNLAPESWSQVQAQLNILRQNDSEMQFAVRSSALSEDSAQASFAGEFETILNVNDDQMIREAIHTVHRSQQAERVQVYSSAHVLAQSHQMAVVIQRMIPADLSGVLFTADPITGSYTNMVGNYVHGLGDQLVSGEANAISFNLARPRGKYDGPPELRPYSDELFQYAQRLERELGYPQDIEWAVSRGKLYLLQARPITTLTVGNLDKYEVNESLAEDTLWVNTNVAEAVPDVFSPLTWTIIRGFDDELNFIPGYYVWSGNICGRVYSNIGRRVSAIAALTGWDIPRILGLLGDIFGQAPDDINVPIRPLSRAEILQEILPGIWRVITNMVKAQLSLKRFLQETPGWSQEMITRLEQVHTKVDLLTLWQTKLYPYTMKAWWGHTTGASGVLNIMALERNLTKLVGREDSNALLSNLRGEAGLDSLGPSVGISHVMKGKMSRDDYLQQYGHRGPHEFELSMPHPSEDANWLEERIAEYEKSAVDVDSLLQKQRSQYEAARQRFQERYPRKAGWLDKQLVRVSRGAHMREATRSEFVRVFRVVRAFALKVGELTGLGTDVFFLYRDEILALLSGNDAALVHIPARKENYEKYKALPPFPSIIRGRFNPITWANDPNRRMDYYDPMAPIKTSDTTTLKGIPGAAGRVEGYVRLLSAPEEGDTLQPGEILVAATTNVGWTLLFPKAAAIITDIGAPLSHAAIVAREMGIPAVVGCSYATTRLKTGDRVLVDGGQGIVQIKPTQSTSIST